MVLILEIAAGIVLGLVVYEAVKRQVKSEKRRVTKSLKRWDSEREQAFGPKPIK